MTSSSSNPEARVMEIVRHAVMTNPELILGIRPKYLTDDLWTFAISANHEIFKYCKMKTYSICMTALEVDGFNLEYIDPLRYTGEQYQNMCELAVQTTPRALAMVPKKFQTKKMKAYAYANDPELLSSEKKLTDNMIKTILDHNPSFIRQVDNPSDDLLIHALARDPRCIVYFENISPRVRDFFEENFPQYASMFHDF